MKKYTCDRCGADIEHPKLPWDLGGRFYHVDRLSRYDPKTIDFDPVDLCKPCAINLDRMVTKFMGPSTAHPWSQE